MKTILTITYDFEGDREAALALYAKLIDVERHEVFEPVPRCSFSGCVYAEKLDLPTEFQGYVDVHTREGS